MNQRHILRAVPALGFVALVLAGCGGGGGGAEVPAVGEVPTGATTNPAQAVEFTRSTAASSSDTAEPIELGPAGLATSETDEPDEKV